MYNPQIITDLIAGNLAATKNPFALPMSSVNRWHKSMRLPAQGEALLVTGLMYQFTPFIESSGKILERYEDTSLAGKIGLGRLAPKRFSGLGLSFITPQATRREADSILRGMASLLVRAGVSFYYDPWLDAYSGILLYDLGDREGFVAQARQTASRLVRNRVKKIITVDPHTTYAFKVLYPRYTGVSFEVTTYFEAISKLTANAPEEKVTLHDPCFFGRYLELSHAPRSLLSGLSVEVAQAAQSGKSTACCGGPAESVSPRLALDIAKKRLESLPASGGPIITMCPICMGNLKRAGAKVEDLSSFVTRRLSLAAKK